ncbi:MAG TPA: HxlR family transcriptional regulator, partial [Pseudonocardiaceae bacterium]
PAGTWVYDLTEWGRELEPILLALGGWGLRVPRAEGATLNSTSMMLFLRGGKPDPADPPAEYRIELGETVWAVRAENGVMHVERGEPAHPAASISTDPVTFNEWLENPTGVSVHTDGDPVALARLSRSVHA